MVEQIKKVYVLGDIHGNIKKTQWGISSNNYKDCFIIQVGDFGVGFTNKNEQIKILKEFNKFLKERNITFLVTHGNHDDPFYFTGDHMYSNLMLLPDYTKMNLNGLNYLFVGGAISIDRKPRINDEMLTHRKSYWVDERFVLDTTRVNEIVPASIDVLITHSTTKEMLAYMDENEITNPRIVDSFVSAYSDYELYNDIDEEVTNIQTLVNMLPNLKEHYFGHFHNSCEMVDKHKTILLNIDEFKEITLKPKK